MSTIINDSPIIDSSIVDTLSLINQIREYEPAIVRIIFDYVFVPCSQDQEGKHKYIRAIPTPGTKIICEKAFFDNKNLEWVIIDKSVETIGEYAFYGCESLIHLTIDNSIKTIGGYAFEHCSNLTHLTIGNSIQTIGKYAFNRCLNLTEVNIPSHLEKIVKERNKKR